MLFDVPTPLGFRVHASGSYWEMIVSVKHPVMRGRENDVAEVLRFPEEIRRSLRDPEVYLFYRSESVSRWTCVVVKRVDGDGFVITTYPTNNIKEGEPIWTR